MATTSTKYDPKAWKWVPVTVGAVKFSYAFKTNVDATFGTLFGHALIDDTTTNLIVGANYPKPARASGKKSDKYGSSYISPAQYAAAKADGFNITASRRGPIAVGSAGADSLSVMVTVAGIDYAWNISDDTYTNLPTDAKTALKINPIITAAQANKSVVAASFPKPAVWKLTLKDKTLSTFGDDDAAIATSATILGARKARRALSDPAVYGLVASS